VESVGDRFGRHRVFNDGLIELFRSIPRNYSV
jgi:hypothetical protein